MHGCGVFDSEDNEEYPDIFEPNIVNMQLSEIPTTVTITERDIKKFWLCMYREYGAAEGDDIWLNINGVPYIGFLEPGQQIYRISPNDIMNFDKNIKAGNE